MFGIVLLTDAPRYFIGIQATAAAFILRDNRPCGPLPPLPPVSILLAGHNEEGAIEKCVRSLRKQTFNSFEIVCVDDGSSDQTFAIMRRLQSLGLVQSIGRLQLRGGKASASNLAARMAHGDILILTDCDCSFEPDAIEEILRPLATDASVVAVSGNILVRNWRRSITTAIQGIEYLVSISLGKTFSGALDQVCCVSGAFGAFRRRAWEADRRHGRRRRGGPGFHHPAQAGRAKGRFCASLDLLYRRARNPLCAVAPAQPLGTRLLLGQVPQIWPSLQPVRAILCLAGSGAPMGLPPFHRLADVGFPLLPGMAVRHFRQKRLRFSRRGRLAPVSCWTWPVSSPRPFSRPVRSIGG